jgi:dTDP-glucose 4,6-dehydratase
MRNLYVISGVAGMTGSELANQLLLQGHRVLGFDNFFASSIKNIEKLLGNTSFVFYKMNLNNESDMDDLEFEISYEIRRQDDTFDKIIFINCAAIVHTEHFYNVNSTFETNVIGMKKFLEMAISFTADIFINCSTSEVYSMQSWNNEGGVKESDYLLLASAEHSQRTSYATGKLLTEFFMKDAVDKNYIKGCSIRFANVYSNDELFPKHIIPHIITSLEKGDDLLLLENARVTKRTFLHNIDSCSSIIALCNNEDSLDGTVYNVSTNEEIHILDLVKMIAEKMGKTPKINYDAYRLSDPPRRLLNIDKIQKTTGWQNTVSIEDGINMILNYRKNEKNSQDDNCNCCR